MAEDYRKTLSDYETQAALDGETLLHAYAQYNPQERKKLQAAAREQLIAVRGANALAFIDRMKTDSKKLEMQIFAKRFPLLNSNVEAERLRGELAVNTALLAQEKFPTSTLRGAYELGRIDFASALEERVKGMEASTAEETAAKIGFDAISRKNHDALGITEIQKQHADLQKVIRDTGFFKKKIEANFSVMQPKTWQEHEALMNKIGAW